MFYTSIFEVKRPLPMKNKKLNEDTEYEGRWSTTLITKNADFTQEMDSHLKDNGNNDKKSKDTKNVLSK